MCEQREENKGTSKDEQLSQVAKCDACCSGPAPSPNALYNHLNSKLMEHSTCLCGFFGAAESPDDKMHACARIVCLLDLLRPRLPSVISRKEVERSSGNRVVQASGCSITQRQHAAQHDAASTECAR